MIIERGGPRPKPGTINRMFFDAVRRFDKPNALQAKVGGRYQPISHRTLAERVRRTALGLQSLGLAPGDRVAILSLNRPEWAIADYGCLTGRYVSVGLYPTLPSEQIAYILKDCGATAVFVSDAKQLAKLLPIRASLPALRAVITFEPSKPAGVDFTMAEIEGKGAAVESATRIEQYEKDAMAVKPDDLAGLVYTSGTTGEPKGVMLTHDNFHSNVMAAAEVLNFKDDDGCLSFLPLSHTFERTAGHFLMLHVGASIAYAESNETISANLLEIRPTVVFSVPRLYEKIYSGAQQKADNAGGMTQKVFHWARRTGLEWSKAKFEGRSPGVGLSLRYALADKLVFSKLRAGVGGRLRVFVSGGAPLSPDVNTFFYSAGLLILEGYGLTETSPVIAVNTPTQFKMGTVGKPVAGVEVGIAADGEIIVRGPNIMRGYYNKPDATAEAIDKDGWFHTGDIGELRDGYLAITDRKKELIVTAGGKKIAPAPIENAIQNSAFVSQAVLIGDRRPYPIALIAPDIRHLERWAKETGLQWKSASELVALPAVRKKMQEEVASSLHGLAKFETPQKIGLLPEELTIERGELTPTLKVKRRVVEKTYAPVIEAVYAEKGSGGDSAH